ncbi:hypothetical protein GCM10009827_117030 [Dactylosporangium maewongense]|uniref:Uncharacterized protein n=1 Tax=Dactylosporangium maewongense TaxID=634393 RepID=A0ABP4P8K6_9ACTN
MRESTAPERAARRDETTQQGQGGPSESSPHESETSVGMIFYPAGFELYVDNPGHGEHGNSLGIGAGAWLPGL